MREMLENVKGGFSKSLFIAVIGIFFSTLLWAFFLNASGLAWQHFLEMSIDTLKAKMLNFNFVFFLVFFSLSLSFACLAALKFSKRGAALSVLIGSIPALLIAFFLFSVVAGYWLLLFVIPLAMMALVFTISIKLAEIKKFTRFRSFMAGIGTFTLIFAIGVFLFGVIEIMPSQQEYLEKIESSLAEGVAGTDLQEKIVEANLRSQYQLLYSIHSSQPYQEMSNVDDERVKAFDQYYIGIVAGVDEAAKNPKEYLEEEGIKMEEQQLDTHTLLEKSIPGYALFSKYFYILYPFMLFTVIISFGNIVFRFLGVAFALALSSALKNI